MTSMTYSVRPSITERLGAADRPSWNAAFYAMALMLFPLRE